jgi:hypothetical protein
METSQPRPEATGAGTQIPPPRQAPHERAPGEEDHDIREELANALANLRDSIVPLWHALVGLVIAQVKLSKILIKEGVRITAARGIVLLHIWLFAGLAWLFLNIGVWRVCLQVDEGGILAPFIILVLHVIAILSMVAYYKRLKL